MQFFGYDIASDAICEICETPCGPPHHINARGMGGSKQRDNIENLIGLCHRCHIDAEAHENSKEYLRQVHYKFMRENGVK